KGGEIVRRKSAHRTEVLAVLRDQYEAGIWPIVNGFRPGVADAVREMMRQALGHIDQQAIILGIPARSCLEINCNRKSAHAGSKRACRNGRAIDVFLSTAALRVKSSHLGGRVRLIYVKEATEMDAADVVTADA